MICFSTFSGSKFDSSVNLFKNIFDDLKKILIWVRAWSFDYERIIRFIALYIGQKVLL